MAKVEGDTPEAVAYRLFLHIADAEKSLVGTDQNPRIGDADREWILRTYAQCIATVRNPDGVADFLTKLGPPR